MCFFFYTSRYAYKDGSVWAPQMGSESLLLGFVSFILILVFHCSPGVTLLHVVVAGGAQRLTFARVQAERFMWSSRRILVTFF